MKKSFAVKFLSVALVVCMLLVGCATASAPAAAGSDAASAAAGSDAAATGSEAAGTPLYRTPASAPTFEGAVYGGTLRIGTRMYTAVTNFGYPFTFVTTVEDEFCCAAPCVETLARYDDEGKLVPWLADSWEIDSDALTFTIHLHPGITFHDGTPFDAEAVIWNLEQSTANGRGELLAISSYEAVDANTVLIKMSQWDSTLEASVLNTCGWIVSPTAVQAHDPDWAAANPVGTGPFVFDSWERDVGIYYNKNTSYWREGEPYLDRIEMKLYADATALNAAMQTGEIDIAMPADENVCLAWAEKGGKTEVGGATGLSIYNVMVPSNNPDLPFYDVRVRQAMAYAIDTKAISEMMSAQGGDYTPVNQWAIPGTFSWNNDVAGYEYNPEKAKELLAEAGYPDGFTCKGYVIAVNALLKQVAEVYSAFLADVGITVENQNNDMAIIYELEGGARHLDGVALYCVAINANSTSTFTTTFSDTGSSYSDITLKPDALTAAIEASKAAKTPEDMAKACQEMNKILSEQCLAIPINLENRRLAVNDYVHNCAYPRTAGTDWSPEAIWMDAH